MNWSRFARGVDDEDAVAVWLGNRTARPQAAGTCRYHLPFNVADETVVAYSLEGKGCLRRPGSNTLGSEQ